MNKIEKYLMKEANVTVEEIKDAYKDRLYEDESYEKWLLETAKANGYKED